jgi:hypothetical protein
LSDRLRIQKLRVIEVAVSRNGKPSDAAIQRASADVDSVFPGSPFELNALNGTRNRAMINVVCTV